MLRGEIWTYRPVLERPGQSLLRIVLSADGFNRDDSRVQVMGAHVVDRDPGGLLSVRVEPHGWVVLTTVEAVMRRRLGERVGAATPDELAAVMAAFRALFEV